MSRKITMAFLVAICAALAITPSMAGAKVVQYQGPINLVKQPGPFRSYQPTMQLKVEFSGKKPVFVGFLHQFGIYGNCSDGTGFDGETSDTFGSSLKVNKGRFSGVDHLNSSLTVTGRVSGKTATGTVRDAFQLSPVSGPGPLSNCDSGVLSWTATKTNHLSSGSELG